MLLNFPDIEGHEKNTLFILGNGFDRIHGLKTSYSDFYDWLQKRHPDFLDVMMRIFSNNQRFSDEEERKSVLWTDFEGALGHIDAFSASSYIEENFGDVCQSHEILSRAVSKMKSVVSDVWKYTLAWSRDIDIGSALLRYYLPKESKYLSFNYTQTLEECYSIPSEQVCHIHGSVREDTVVVGCERDTRRAFDNRTRGRRNYSKDINTVFDEFNKPVDEVQEKHLSFFNPLSSIEHIIVIGHSFSDIDMPYLKDIAQTATKARWHISAYSNQDYKNVMEFIDSELGGIINLRQNQHRIFNVDMKLEEKDIPPKRRTAKRPSLQGARRTLANRGKLNDDISNNLYTHIER